MIRTLFVVSAVLLLATPALAIGNDDNNGWNFGGQRRRDYVDRDVCRNQPSAAALEICEKYCSRYECQKKNNFFNGWRCNNLRGDYETETTWKVLPCDYDVEFLPKGTDAVPAASPASLWPEDITALNEGAEFTVAGNDGDDIRVSAAGPLSGDAIVFVHGYSQARQTWANYFADKKLTRKYRLVAMDIRGHGDSQKYTEASSLPTITNKINSAEIYRYSRIGEDLIRILIDTSIINPSAKITLVGSSRGALWAIAPLQNLNQRRQGLPTNGEGVFPPIPEFDNNGVTVPPINTNFLTTTQAQDLFDRIVGYVGFGATTGTDAGSFGRSFVGIVKEAIRDPLMQGRSAPFEGAPTIDYILGEENAIGQFIEIAVTRDADPHVIDEHVRFTQKTNSQTRFNIAGFIQATLNPANDLGKATALPLVDALPNRPLFIQGDYDDINLQWVVFRNLQEHSPNAIRHLSPFTGHFPWIESAESYKRSTSYFREVFGY